MSIEQFERILITGGRGFIGSALVKQLVEHGKRPMVADLRVDEAQTNGEFSIARIDLTNEDQIRSLVEDFEPELVIHLAGSTIRDDRSGAISDEINFEPARSILKSLAKIGGGKAILMGSAGEYGDNPTPFTEEMDPRPISPYARSKARATKFALEFGEQNGLDVTVLRAFTAYGPNQPANMFLSQLVTHAVLNDHFNMSAGTQLRDLVYIDDVVAALIAAASSPRSRNRIINIASGRPIALRDAAAYVWDRCGADPQKLVFGEIASSGDDALDTWADISRAEQLLDWSPQISFEKGIDTMIAAARDELGQ